MKIIKKILGMDLKPSEKLVLIYLYSDDNNRKNNLEISKDIMVTLPTVISALENLNHQGIIAITFERGEHIAPVRYIHLHL